MFDNFSKTAAVQWFRAVAGVLAMLGVTFDVDAIVALLNEIGPLLISLWMLIESAVGLKLRAITTGPVAKWWGARS